MPDSIEEIQKTFDKRIKALEADDEDGKRALTLEMREQIADFREQQASTRELEAHKAKMVAEKGLTEWADLITGVTLEEIDAQASKIAERVAKLTEVREQAGAEAAYGTTGVAGGQAPGTREPETVENLHDYERRFNEGTRGSAIRRGNDGKIGIQESEQYVAKVLGARGVDHLARNSAVPAMRVAAGRIDTRTLGEKQ